MKLTKPIFAAIPGVDVYAKHYAEGDECPEGLIKIAKSLGALEETKMEKTKPENKMVKKKPENKMIKPALENKGGK